MYGDSTAGLVEGTLAQGVDHAVVLMRHSARTFEPGLHDLLNGLTDEGRALCRRLGQALPKDLTLRAYASPVQRCMETSELILAAHQAEGGAVTRHRPVEGLGVFYVLDQMKMWRGLDEIGLPAYLQGWFDGKAPADALMPADLAARLVLQVMAEKLNSPVARPQLDLCVSHDMTLYLVRDQLLGQPAQGPKVEFLDGMIAWRAEGALWLQSPWGAAQRIITEAAA